MNSNLSLYQQQIISNLCKNHIQKKMLAQKAIAECLTENEIEEICNIISNEFLLNGITESFEANAYGKELENILDIINKVRLRN